ncbi:MAG: ATP-binding cassette domain-containing protein [Oscillospiraceae bacterium]|nr:ATP-binding cassette domain-containing protein [Oscillospiraceae bacterium]
MSNLRLENIEKIYKGSQDVHALRGVSLEFRESEFVAILGPSGCGKTTLLNIVGGLDRYTEGDLVIRGVSTRRYSDADWDAYRNRSIGFVFQNYNLIAHQSVLQNVEISLTLSGVSPAERRRRAEAALEAVELSDQLRKRPNQLSGGQMQRVAIARALVNEPDILLCDEPTGALDSRTGGQVMEILKKIARTRLVIMVTHNAELAGRYATRTIHLLDGKVISDSLPLDGGEADRAAPPGKPRGTAMSLRTATALSFQNLLTKKGRTIITAIAGSIGIIGVALVLALSSGLSSYMGEVQSGTLSGFPISIGTNEVTVDTQDFGGGRQEMRAAQNVLGIEQEGFEKYPEGDVLYRYDRRAGQVTHRNVLTDEYLAYIRDLDAALPGAVNTITYARGVALNLLSGAGEAVVRMETGGSDRDGMGGVTASLGVGGFWQEMPDNEDFVLSLYDLIGENSRLPAAENEIALVVDEYNRVNESLFSALGLYESGEHYTLDDFLGKTLIKVIPNDDFYTERDGVFIPADASRYEALYEDAELALTVTGALRLKEDAANAFFSPGLIYTTALTGAIAENAAQSAVAKAQAESEHSVLTGAGFRDGNARRQTLLRLGADTSPTSVSIYPKDFQAKDSIKEYLDRYNEGRDLEDSVLYNDLAEAITNMTGTLLNTVSTVLVGFAAISLLVSSIMIGIITYVSVLERTREIGILRSVGARKKDIARVFNAETLIIGLAAGVIGVCMTYLLAFPINAVIHGIVGLDSIAALPLPYAGVLIAGSMALTLTAGLLPSGMAARKDPVAALRTE